MTIDLKHLLSTSKISPEIMLEIFQTAAQMEKIISLGQKDKSMEGKILATLFWEPSTRTRFSFETAMLKLGGQVISNSSMSSQSSVKKGETLYDTARTVSSFADIIAVRHPESGSVAEFAQGSTVPVINAGDGPADHPTQGLLDIYTIWKWRCGGELVQAFDGLTIGMVGDLKYSRVVHSQIELLKSFNCKFILVSPEALRLPEKYLEMLKENNCEYEETEDLELIIKDFDVLSDTRIQQERFEDRAEFEKYRTCYVIDSAMMSRAKENMILLSPLPRFGELLPEVDSDPRARYFEQISNGVALRMALIKMMVG